MLLNEIIKIGVKLKVLNLSHQTDASDLIGGFRPIIHNKKALLPLVKIYNELIQKTWQK